MLAGGGVVPLEVIDHSEAELISLPRVAHEGKPRPLVLSREQNSRKRWLKRN